MRSTSSISAAVEHAVRHRLAHPDAGDLGDDVVQALEVLDVHRGPDVDAGRQQLLDVLPALRVPAAGRVAVGELVDQRQLRAAREQRVEVHLLEHRGRDRRRCRRGQDLEAGEQRRRLRRPWVSTTPTTTSIALLGAGAGLLQHLVGLADARRHAEEDLQPPAALLACGLEQGLGRGPRRVAVLRPLRRACAPV